MYFCEQYNITHFAFRWILHYPMKMFLRSVWLEGLENRRMKYWEGIEKWEDRRYLAFSHLCLIERIENLFVWLRRKMRGWKMKLV